MWQLPPIPSWDGLHPLIIHFPIVLTFIAPVFILLAIPKWRARVPLALAGAALLIAASVSAWISVSTGEAAGELAMRSPEVDAVLETHEGLAEFSAKWLTGLAVGLVVIAGAAVLLRRIRQPVWIVGTLALLLFQAVGILAVTNTAHNGGRLVHEFGIHALLPKQPTPSPSARNTSEEHERESRGHDD